MNILNQKNKQLYTLPKIPLSSTKDYELLDFVLSFTQLPFYFSLTKEEEENFKLDLIFTDRDDGFEFRYINNFADILKLIKIDEGEKVPHYIFKDFKVINKFCICDENNINFFDELEWNFDIILLLKCLKTKREKYVLFEFR